MSKSKQKWQVSLDNIKPALKRLLELRMDKKDIEAEIKELDEQVRPIISDRGKMQLDNYVFECKQQAGRKAVNKEKLKAFLEAHGAKYEDFEEQGAPFTVLKVEEVAVQL
jgi:nicotinate-nucleotide pyrophosphorylase